jgi:hypothetical protein
MDDEQMGRLADRLRRDLGPFFFGTAEADRWPSVRAELERAGVEYVSLAAGLGLRHFLATARPEYHGPGLILSKLRAGGAAVLASLLEDFGGEGAEASQGWARLAGAWEAGQQGPGPSY